VAGALIVLLVLLVASTAVRGESPITLRDVTPQTGITFKHTTGGSGQYYIVEGVCCGMATFDYDGDGWIDIYFLNGAPLRGTRTDKSARNVLYRNNGGLGFTDVTDEAGVGDLGYGLGVVAADYDGDGDQDLYLNNFGPNVLYRNEGDGTFSVVTATAGTGNGNRVGAGAAFFDMDKDGDLDLYASNYVVFSYDLHRPRTYLGAATYQSPQDYEPDPDTLYRNNGDETFADVSVESGVARHAGTGMGMVCVDYDNDGDTDVFVCNDVRGNFLFENDGTGSFDEVGLITGAAYDFSGIQQASMGVDCGDYNNDGFLDLFMTDFEGELPTLYRNSGKRFFEDVTVAAHAGTNAVPYVNWGTGLVDFDNDGDRDIFVANGHLMDAVNQHDDTSHYAASNILLRNLGNGRFVDVSDKSGDGLQVKLVSRGTGFDDLDNDGDIDVVILNSRQEPTILRNDSRNDHHWIQIRLRGTKTNRDGVGARVRVVAGDLAQIDEVHSGRGYQSHHGMRLHLGLGPRDRVDLVEVRWIGGVTEVFESVKVDRLVTLIEGTGRARPETR